MTFTVAKLKRAIAADPTALTILAEKLSERPDSDDSAERQAHQDAKLGTPTSYIARADCPTAIGDVCKQGQRCCQRRPAGFDKYGI